MPTTLITTEEFKSKIFDYVNEKDWKSKSSLPILVDFYADWCAPCRMVAPILEELAEIYKDKVVIYKVNTESEPELAAVFGIQSIPSFLFIPVEKDPFIQPGAFPKNVFREIIDEHLLS
ncbi:MAG: thiol reductase thioredoxin [Bacteroidetes bacterium]|nr:thiol reductase thioredoxin [Bacteroidota bacterium]